MTGRGADSTTLASTRWGRPDPPHRRDYRAPGPDARGWRDEGPRPGRGASSGAGRGRPITARPRARPRINRPDPLHRSDYRSPRRKATEEMKSEVVGRRMLLRGNTRPRGGARWHGACDSAPLIHGSTNS